MSRTPFIFPQRERGLSNIINTPQQPIGDSPDPTYQASRYKPRRVLIPLPSHDLFGSRNRGAVMDQVSRDERTPSHPPAEEPPKPDGGGQPVAMSNADCIVINAQTVVTNNNKKDKKMICTNCQGQSDGKHQAFNCPFAKVHPATLRPTWCGFDEMERRQAYLAMRENIKDPKKKYEMKYYQEPRDNATQTEPLADPLGNLESLQRWAAEPSRRGTATSASHRTATAVEASQPTATSVESESEQPEHQVDDAESEWSESGDTYDEESEARRETTAEDAQSEPSVQEVPRPTTVHREVFYPPTTGRPLRYSTESDRNKRQRSESASSQGDPDLKQLRANYLRANAVAAAMKHQWQERKAEIEEQQKAEAEARKQAEKEARMEELKRKWDADKAAMEARYAAMLRKLQEK